jgi:hypothetical protein
MYERQSKPVLLRMDQRTFEMVQRYCQKIGLSCDKLVSQLLSEYVQARKNDDHLDSYRAA